MASERELGMSQLIDAMTPNKRRWKSQAARLLANHLAFDILYAPSWVIASLMLSLCILF
jgi:ATP-binding cassette subfamily A (ABC1) protein 3